MSTKALGLERRRKIGKKAKIAGSSQLMQSLAGLNEDTGFHSEDHGCQGRVLKRGMPHIKSYRGLRPWGQDLSSKSLLLPTRN